MSNSPATSEPSESFDILILGAGMAGLAAARTLAEAGRRVSSSSKPPVASAGRMLTHREDAEIIELGAEFVHGRPPELLGLIAEAGLSLFERTGDFLQLHEGKLTPPCRGQRRRRR